MYDGRWGGLLAHWQDYTCMYAYIYKSNSKLFALKYTYVCVLSCTHMCEYSFTKLCVWRAVVGIVASSSSSSFAFIRLCIYFPVYKIPARASVDGKVDVLLHRSASRAHTYISKWIINI